MTISFFDGVRPGELVVVELFMSAIQFCGGDRDYRYFYEQVEAKIGLIVGLRASCEIVIDFPDFLL